jgi:trehalose 6-phosphate phosphatase
VPSAATLAEALAPLRDEPARTAVLLDVDGTLAPIVRHAEEAHVPERTRALLAQVAKRYALVACVTGRRASDARGMVGLGTVSYLGVHGTELLRAGGTEPVLEPDVKRWAPRVQDFGRRAEGVELRRLRVRREDKGAIVAFHWRGAPDEAAAHAALQGVAERAQDAGLRPHWGRKVLEVRPPVRMDKGVGIAGLLRDANVDAALYAGDDATDLDAFRGLTELREAGRLARLVLVGVVSDEGPSQIADEADVTVEGPEGMRALLHALLATP